MKKPTHILVDTRQEVTWIAQKGTSVVVNLPTDELAIVNIKNLNEIQHPHVHKDIIIAWANGAKIGLRGIHVDPTWDPDKKYEIFH